MEIAPGVFIAYAAHDFTENLHIVGEETLLHPFADQAAEDAAEIFMPCIDENLVFNKLFSILKLKSTSCFASFAFSTKL